MSETEINRVRLHYDVLGEGEPIAFLNGVMMTTQSWVLQTAFFRNRFRCVLHDFRGQLLSDKPDEQWTMVDHVEDFLGLLDHLEIERCHIVGTSYGGEIGMIFAVNHPERLKSLSVISCVSELEPALDRAVQEWKKAALEDPSSLYRISAPVNFSPGFVDSNPQLISQGAERLGNCPPEFFPAFARLVDAFRQLDITRDLHRIACPTLILVGEKDALKPPRYSKRIVEAINGSEYLMVPGAGHAVIIEKPLEINTAVLGFLEKHR